MADEPGKLKWVICEECGQQTPEYLRTCFKCGKRRLKADQKGPEPAPVPPKPTPPPAKPTGWWNCPKCEDLNPPLGERCLKCHAVRPGYEKPAEPSKSPVPKAPEAPKAPSVPTNWKALIGKAVAIGGSLATLISVASFFVPALAPVAAVIKAIMAVLSQLFSGVSL